MIIAIICELELINLQLMILQLQLIMIFTSIAAISSLLAVYLFQWLRLGSLKTYFEFIFISLRT